MENSQASHPTGYRLLGLCIGALGVVYGDLGTSVLYSVRESFHPGHGIALTQENVTGVISLILWALLLIASIKYVGLLLKADNHGEGGILVLTTLVGASPAKALKSFAFITMIGLFGTTLVYGDGMLTPAITVLSAVEGLSLITPAFNPYIVPIALSILVIFFSLQYKGTANVGRMFGPVMAIWFLTLAMLGLINIVKDPSILHSLSPHHAVAFVIRNGWHSFWVLGAVFLVLTGAEAMYADMGHFGPKPIRLNWFILVFPALILNYLGQGALLLQNPEAAKNPLFLLAPSWALPPLVLLATAASIIASQCLLTGSFSLTMQAVQLGYLPRIKVNHTSSTERGQIYVPLVNWTLMICCCTLVLAFRSSSGLAAAYGVAVTLTMLSTTMLFFYLARYVWHWGIFRCFSVCGTFFILESVFFAANMLKVFEGGWIPLAAGAILFTIMSTWKRGRAYLGKLIQERTQPLAQTMEQLKNGDIRRFATTAVFMYGNPLGTPPALLSNLRHCRSLAERVLIVGVQILEKPQVPIEEQIAEVTAQGQGLYRIKLQFGYMDQPDVPRALQTLQIDDQPVDTASFTYFLGRENLLPTSTVKSDMLLWREHLFATLSRNACDATAFFRIPTTQVVEVGTQIEL